MMIAMTTRLLPSIVPKDRNERIITTGVSGKASSPKFSRCSVLCAELLFIMKRSVENEKIKIFRAC